MPYIPQADRFQLQAHTELPSDVGELNYAITKLCVDYAKRAGIRYATHNSIMGVLECAKQEWYRRMVVPYEDMKCQENGDVY